jgi:hypothetical protein
MRTGALLTPTVFSQGTFKIWDLVPVRAGVAHCLMSFRLPGLTGPMAPEAFAFRGDTSAILAGRARLMMFMVCSR